MYPLQRVMNQIKHHKIKLINIIPDIPPWRLSYDFQLNSFKNYLRQQIYNFTHKQQIIYEKINKIKEISARWPYFLYFSKYYSKIIDTNLSNKIFYIENYRNFLKKSDLVLSFSNFTRKLIKKYINLPSKVWYPCANTDLIKNIPEGLEKTYDAINISRIVPHKQQSLFVSAAQRLNLKIAIIGPHQDKGIKLDCPHFPLTHEEALIALQQTGFYVDPSSFEGFGMTPVEAAFLNKITIASDIQVHKEILGNYPLYFRTGDLKDLIQKMELVLQDNFQINKSEVELIKKKYSIETAKEKLIEFIESVLRR